MHYALRVLDGIDYEYEAIAFENFTYNKDIGSCLMYIKDEMVANIFNLINLSVTT